MKRRPVIIVVGAALLFLLGFFGWLILRLPAEPMYEGKPLSYWLEDQYVGTNGWEGLAKAQRAIRQAGTNAIPTLLRMVSAHDSALKLKFVSLARGQSLVKIRHVPAEQRNLAGHNGFTTLGPTAAVAVPDLIKIYERNVSANSQVLVVRSLGFIGPGARPAVPMLLRALANTNAEVRSVAAGALGSIGTEPAVIVPALMKSLHDPDWGVRDTACASLSLLAAYAKLAVPELVALLADENSMIRDAASRALWVIDPPAAAATVLPMRIKYLGSANPYVRAHNAYELGNLGTRAAPAKTALRELLKDSDMVAQAAAATALNQIEPATAATVSTNAIGQ